MVQRRKEKSEKRYNHLKDEKSPYLIQHSQNPVDWYPWGDEAFKKANGLIRDLNRIEKKLKNLDSESVEYKNY